MAKLHLVIADSDESYVESLISYLTDSYPQKFQVSYFTKEDYLVKHLSDTSKKVDILLVGPELSEYIPKDKINTMIILSDGRLPEKYRSCAMVNKYQTGDKLVSSILNIFSERNADEVYIQSSNKPTRVIGVYSPTGGTGKTSIAIGSAMQSALRDMPVFYLNLENAQSTPLFFDCKGEQNLSHIFYFLKEKSKNINLKIEGVRIVDPKYNIHYFAPPESVLEFEEISPDELQYLINQLKELGCYDVIFIDMSSNFDNRNLAVLQACDEIFLVLTQDDISGIKLKTLISEMDIASPKSNANLNDKLTLIINKFNPMGPTQIEGLDILGKPISLRIPKVSSLLTRQSDKYVINLNNNFGEALKGLVNKY